MSDVTLVVRRPSTKTFLARSRGWISILLLTPIGAYAMFSAPYFDPDSWGQLSLETAGWLLFLAGAMFRWWGTLYIGGRKGNQLVSQGAYSVCRNPLYFGTYLLVLAIGVMMQSLCFCAVSFPIAAWYLSITVAGEEGRLRERFGPEFDDYCLRVPRLFPRLGLARSPRTIEVEALGLYAEWKRSCRWLLIPVLCHILLFLRAQAWWPHPFHLP